MLKIQLPENLANQEVEICLVIQPKTISLMMQKRPLGQYTGKIWMSEDFSAR